MAGDRLTRTSVGLSPTHRELIRLLAERAVEQYLAEVESAETTDDQQEAAP